MTNLSYVAADTIRNKATRIQNLAASKRQREIQEANTPPPNREGVTDTGAYPPPTKESWRNLRYEEYGWISSVFESFLTPDPYNLNPMIKDLSDAIESLRLNEAGGSDGHTKSALYTKLSGWNSEAVTNFKEVWLKGFNSAHGHQIIAIEALKSSLEACRDALLALRIDVDHIADATILALEDSGQDVPQALQIAGAVFVIAAGVAGIPVTGGASLAVTAQAVAAGFTIAAGVTSGIQSQVGAKGAPTGKAGSWTVSGDLVEDIIVSMKGSLNDAIIEFDNAKLAIGGALSSMSDAVDTKSRQKYLPPRPGIANATPGTATEFVS